MHTTYKTTLFLFVSLLLVFTSCKKKNYDNDIRTAFTTKVQSDPNLAGVSALVSNGTVTLTGTCGDENCRSNAEKTVKDIEHVDKVVNNIQIAEVRKTDDAALRSSAQSAISKYSGVEADVNNGIITLRGSINDRDKLQQLMMELNALGPKRIDNQLVIKK